MKYEGESCWRKVVFKIIFNCIHHLLASSLLIRELKIENNAPRSMGDMSRESVLTHAHVCFCWTGNHMGRSNADQHLNKHLYCDVHVSERHLNSQRGK